MFVFDIFEKCETRVVFPDHVQIVGASVVDTRIDDSVILDSGNRVVEIDWREFQQRSAEILNLAACANSDAAKLLALQLPLFDAGVRHCKNYDRNLAFLWQN